MRRHKARYGHSPTGNPLTKYVNMFQSAEERNLKYAYARACGFGVDKATHLRSWRWGRILMIVEASSMEGLITINHRLVKRLTPKVRKFYDVELSSD